MRREHIHELCVCTLWLQNDAWHEEWGVMTRKSEKIDVLMYGRALWLLAVRRKGWRYRNVDALNGCHVSLPAWDNLPWSPIGQNPMPSTSVT